MAVRKPIELLQHLHDKSAVKHCGAVPAALAQALVCECSSHVWVNEAAWRAHVHQAHTTVALASAVQIGLRSACTNCTSHSKKGAQAR